MDSSDLARAAAAPLSISTADGADTASARHPLTARARDLALLLVTGMLWGIQPVLIKATTQAGLSEIESVALVLAFVAASLGTALLVRARLFRPTGRVLLFMTISGVAEYAAPLLITFLVAGHIDAGLLSLIIATTPVFVVGFAAAIGDEPLRRQTVVACLLGLLGFAMIVAPGEALPTREMLPWCLAAFSIPAVYACGSIYVARAWPSGMDAMQVAFGGAIIASVLLAPFWVQSLAAGRSGPGSMTAYLALGALVAVLLVEMVLYFHLLQLAGAVFTSFSSFVMIITGFAGGALLFGERVSLWIWASVALLSASLWLAITGSGRPQRASLELAAGSTP